MSPVFLTAWFAGLSVYDKINEVTLAFRACCFSDIRLIHITFLIFARMAKKQPLGLIMNMKVFFCHFFFSYRSSVLCETIKSPASVINTEVIHSRVKITLHFKGHLFSWSRKTWTVTESPESVSSLKILYFHTDVT